MIATMSRTTSALFAMAFLAVGVQPALAQDDGPAENMSFFITSAGPGNGADLGGLAGADAHCQMLAAAAGAGDRTWRAYLSTVGPGGVDARDRIGDGPWYNFAGVEIASDVDELHGENNLTAETVLNEEGGSPMRHDVLTGSNLDGTALEGDAASATCGNWTSSTDGSGSAQLGHYDRRGGGQNATSWNSAHASRGCSQANLVATNGDGLFYCFATD